MQGFDPSTLADPAIRERYERLEKRGASLAEAVRGRFGPGRGDIRVRFAPGATFNAFADRDGHDYLIEIAAAVPVLVILLFERILSDAKIMPWVDTGDDSPSCYDVPFIIDPRDFDQRTDWIIQLSRDRGFAADFLADFALTFILMHEAGHILCGHIDVARADGSFRLAEMFDAPAMSKTAVERNQAWEADADSVSATLLLDYVVELAKATSVNDQAGCVFGRGDRTIEHILAISLVALYALFAYLRGVRYALDLASSHPHPFVRAHYIKDMLLRSAQERWDLDMDFFHAELDARLDEMLIVLEEIGLHDSKLFTSEHIRETNRKLKEIEVLRGRYRKSATAWFQWS